MLIYTALTTLLAISTTFAEPDMEIVKESVIYTLEGAT